jgi:hypothetical protein
MHSQAVDLTCTKLVLEPSTKLMFGASLTTSDASECVSVHSLDAEVGRHTKASWMQLCQQNVMDATVSKNAMDATASKFDIMPVLPAYL